MGRADGVREEQLRDLADHRSSPHFSDLEKRVLDLAEAMTRTPPRVDDALVAGLRQHLDEAQLVELTAAIAWENWRARFNRAMGVESQGFSEGAWCPVPERTP